MSSYYRSAYHPLTNTVKQASWLDDYFGRHMYGVRFDDDDKVYTPEEVEIPMDIIFVPEDESFYYGDNK